MKSLFFLSPSNYFSWCIFKLNVGLGLFDLYKVQSSLDNFSRSSSTSGNFLSGGGI